MNLFIVDTETTGLTPADARCIEVGGILFSVDERAVLGAVFLLLPTDENPVAHINGIRADLTRRPQAARAGMEYFYAMAKQADYVVAHNAEFDRQWFGHGSLPALTQQWICTMEDVEWPRVSRSRPGVMHLALAYGVPVWAAHRALTDCIYLAQVMEREPDLELLLTTALEPKRLYMAMVSYDDRQKAKDAGFRWDGEQRRWLRKMRDAQVRELAFGVRGGGSVSNANDFAKTCKEVLGIKGRFLLLGLGIAGLFFPGLVGYIILSGVAKGLKDVDVRAMLKELEQD